MAMPFIIDDPFEPCWDPHPVHELERDRDRWRDQYRQTDERLNELTRQRDYFRTELIAAEMKLADVENAVDKLIEATGGLTVEFQVQPPFTVAVLVDPISERVFTGATCCGLHDKFNDEIGKAISLGRAMASRAECYAKAAYGK